MAIRTTCPYCGTGCGLLVHTGSDGLRIEGDPHHPANYGRLCAKGAALDETLDLEGRLLHPEIHGRPTSWDRALDAVASGLARTIQQHGPEAVAFYVSGQLLTEDYYVANKLMKGFIGTANIDTNSRLCMASSVAGHKRAFGSDTVPCSYEDLERAKLIVLVGSNTAWCHPVLYQRILQAKADNPDLHVILVDPRRTATAEIADLHLALRPGSDALLFNGLLGHLEATGEREPLFTAEHTEGLEAALAAARASAPTVEAVAAACELEPEQVREFYRLFARTERVVTVYSQGINQSSSGSDKVNAIINCHLFTGRIGRPGMGPFSFTGQPNAMGGREVGGLANQLAAHMNLDDPAQRALVQRFWRAPHLAQKSGLKAVELFHAVEAGQIKALWIMGTNPVVSLPEAERVKRALEKCPLVVVSDCMRQTDTVDLAHIRLPALAWGEKDGTVTNSERRISRQRPFLPPPGAARADWWIVTQVARRMGFAQAFAYRSVAGIFDEHARLSGLENGGCRGFDLSGLAGLKTEDYESLPPVQWPVNTAHPNGTARLFADGRFFTPSGRARFVAISPRPPRHATDRAFPFILNSGRVRDHWHTLTRTGKSPRLSSHTIEPYVEVHPEDADRQGLVQGELARVSTQLGALIVRVQRSPGQRRGSLFVPMHWNGQFACDGRLGRLLRAEVDPLSGQPELKQTPARIEAYRPAWHGFLLSRRQLRPDNASYWARSRGPAVWRYQLAGEQIPADWAQAARHLLCSPAQDVGWIEYFAPQAKHYRAARLLHGRLESCIFIGPQPALPEWDWLQTLFAKQQLSELERHNLLAARPPEGDESQGRIVCACNNVGERRLQQAITEQGADSVEALGRLLKAGTGCGACVPELRQLLPRSGLKIALVR